MVKRRAGLSLRSFFALTRSGHPARNRNLAKGSAVGSEASEWKFHVNEETGLA